MRHAIMTSALVLAICGGGLAAGCGGGGSGADVATPFVGAWTFDTGNVDAMCGAGIGDQMLPLAGLSGTITKDDNSHITFTANPSCIIKFSVSGQTASVITSPAPSCSIPTQSFGTPLISISTWTFTLSGSTLATSFSGTVSLGISCPTTGSGTLTMHAATDGGADGATAD
jgi:hypothetical protein